MGQPQPQQQQTAHSGPAKSDGKLRVYLYVHEGDLEAKKAREYLEKYDDDAPDAKVATIRKVSELRLDRIREHWIIIPVVRDITSDRAESIEINGRFRVTEHHGKVRECTPIHAADFCKDAPDGDMSGSNAIDENGLVNRIAQVCGPAAPRVQNRGDGRGNNVRWLVLRWG